MWREYWKEASRCTIQELGQIRIEYPLDVGAGNPERQGIKRIMLPATRPESITEAEEVSLVNLIQYGDHGPLDDFIFQRRNAEGPLAPIRLREVLSADGLSTIRLVLEVVETLLQALPIFLPGLSIDPWGGITLERVVCLPQTVHSEVVEQGGHPLGFLPTGSLPYTPQHLGHARPALRPVRVTCRLFPLVTALPSTHSAARRGTLFAGFFGTMAMSDCSGPYITGVGVCLPCADHPAKAWPVLSSPGSRLRSVHACWGSQTAQSPRSTRVSVLLDIAFHPPTSVGALD